MIYEDLKEYQDTSKEIRQIEEIIREKWLKLSSLTSPQITDMPIAPNYDKDKLGRQFAEFDELNRMYSQKLEQLNAKQINVEQAIENLKPKYRRLIRLKYINGLSSEEIARESYYSKRHVDRLIKQGIEKLSLNVPK